jgi:hypothetical protein
MFKLFFMSFVDRFYPKDIWLGLAAIAAIAAAGGSSPPVD